MIVQKLRLQRGWTQEELAILSGVSTRTIQRIERGQPPSTETLKALAAVFEVDFQTLKEPDMSDISNPPFGGGVSADERLAFDHVRRIKRFYVHALIYCVVIALLATLNLTMQPHRLWFQYTAIGWGAGVLVQALIVFRLVPLWGADWEKRQVETYLGRKL